MKPLIIFYSLSGNTKLMAESMAEAVGAELMELKLVKKVPAKGFMKYFLGGKEAMTKAKPELLPLDKNPREYDMLFIGTPVWAGSHAPAMNTFFSTHPLTNKKTALFCCHGGGKGKVFANMNKALEGNQVLGAIDFKEPLKKNKEQNIQKAKDWAEGIMKTIG